MTNMNNDKDETFWKNYLDFPFDQLLENIEVLETETETENESAMQVINETETESIEEYLDKDLFPPSPPNNSPTSGSSSNEDEKAYAIMEHALPQFIFALDNIPPFYFLFPSSVSSVNK